MRGLVSVGGVVAWLVVAACARAPLAPGAAGPSAAPAHAAAARPADQLSGISFEFTPEATLDGLRARVCFRGRPPPALQSGMHSDDIVLRQAWFEGPRGRRPLSFDRTRVSLSGVPSGGCIGYALDFDASRAHFGAPAVERSGDAIVANIAGWLLRPSTVVAPDVDVRARFTLADGMRVSVPWRREGDQYKIEASAFVFYSFAAFGHFETEQIDVAGGRIEVAVLDGLPPATRAAVVPWLSSAAAIATQALGRFPRPRAQIVVVPAPAADVPVRYGMMNRGGGSSALMLLPVNATREALERDWVAVHEFCHLLHPFVQREDAWLSEGLATYFAEVLRTRAGVESEQLAWQRLYDGAQLGAGVPRGLRDETAQMYAGGSFKRVYWGGAAFALMADVAVRRYSHGTRSLPSLLGEVLPTWVHEPRAFSAVEVVALLDRALGAPLLHDLMQRWVLGDAMPNLEAVYASLGMGVSADGVQLDGAAAEAWIRDGIMHDAAAPAADRAARAR